MLACTAACFSVLMCVQTAEGNLPRATTASEFAAFLDLHILPDLRQMHIDNPVHGSFEADCREFARELGLDDAHSHLVQLPAWISLDNATIHPWGRKLMCNPRASSEDIDKHVRSCLYHEFGNLPGLEKFTLSPGPKPVQPQRPPKRNRRGASGHVPAHVHGEADRKAVRDALHDVELAEYHTKLAAWEEEDRAWRSVTAVCNRVYKKLEQLDTQRQPGEHTWMQRTLRKLADQRKDVRILLPQQFMPLAKVTPDVHCVVEHMVNTLKLAVKQRALLQLHSDVLFRASAWQEWLLEAVQERGNGAAGRKHISRSIEKQKCVCKILCTPAGESVTLHYVFGDGGANPTGRKCTTWVVKGTGGGWILDSKWT